MRACDVNCWESLGSMQHVDGIDGRVWQSQQQTANARARWCLVVYVVPVVVGDSWGFIFYSHFHSSIILMTVTLLYALKTIVLPSCDLDMAP